MTKDNLILKYFQRSHLLTVKNRSYRSLLSSLFLWLIEADEVKNDVTTKSLKINGRITAKIICHDEHVVLAGIEEVEFLLSKHTKIKFTPLKKDKDLLSKNETIIRLNGRASEILAYERTILNILQRMTGIATQTYKLTTYNLQPTTYIAATRKTPWMWLDKKAVAVGGGLTHRLNLADGILVKDNHIKLKAKGKRQKAKVFVEIEVETYKQAFNILKTCHLSLVTCHHLALMLDNFTPEEAKQTVENLKKEFYLEKIIIEASGGIDEKNIAQWSKTGVDILSLGSLTHSARAANFSLEI